MALFSDLDLSGDVPLHARPAFGRGPRQVHSTRLKKLIRIATPIVAVAIAMALFFVGRMFYLMLTGQ